MENLNWSFFYCFNRITSTLYSPPMFVCKINMLHLYRHWSKAKISNWFLILWFRIIKTSLKCRYHSFGVISYDSWNVTLIIFVYFKCKKNFRFETDTEVPSLLSSIATRATTSTQIDKISQFSENNELGSNKVLQTALNSANFNLKWASENVPEIKSFLNNAVTSSVSFILLLGVAFVAFFNH